MAPLTQDDADRVSIGRDVGRTLRLAWPVVLGRIGVLLLAAVDIAMTGRYGAEELAYYALAIAPFIPLMLLGLGLIMGAGILVAQSIGAMEPRACGLVLRVALAHAALVGVAMALVCHAGELFFALTGQPPGLAEGGARVLVAMGWGLPAALLYAACTFFLEGIHRPLPGMVAMAVANVLNVALNWMLIEGNLDAPALGAFGAAAATTAVRWLTFFGLLGYIFWRIDRAHYAITGSWAGGREIGRRLRRLGLPLSLAHGVEASAFSAMTLIAGWLGAMHVAAYQIGMNLVALGFMGALGLGSAGSVRVGNAVGRGDRAGARRAGWIAVALTCALMIVLGVVFYAFRHALAGIYADDQALVAAAVPVVAVAALALFSDGLQGAIMGGLRGIGDVWPATALYVLAFWGVMVPVGYHLAVRQSLGAEGLMWSVFGAATLAAAMLAVRFQIATAKPLTPA